MPYRIADLELTALPAALALSPGEAGLAALVRLRGRPVGLLVADGPVADLPALAAAEVGLALVRASLSTGRDADAGRPLPPGRGAGRLAVLSTRRTGSGGGLPEVAGRRALLRRHVRAGAEAARAASECAAPRLELVRAVLARLRALRGPERRLAAAELVGLATAKPGPSAPRDPFAPLDAVHTDLVDLHVPAGPDGAYVVLWHGDDPLGHMVLTPQERSDPATVRWLAHDAVAPAVADRLLGWEGVAPNRFPPPPAVPELDALLALEDPLARIGAPPTGLPAPASVIVCTRRRPRDLERCLASLAALDPPATEIVVVDNDPGDPATRAVVDRHAGVRYVAEPRPGLSRARNAGLRAARGELIAFVDDDTRVHRRWLGALLAPFADPRIDAVTGCVLPEELRTRAQLIFEVTMSSGDRGHRAITFDERFFAPQRRLGAPVWTIGAGASMALRRATLDRVGDFDERLGAGAAGCSEDSELWYRILAAGGVCRYEPRALVLHRHRETLDELRTQAHDYLRGHVAALFVQYADHGDAGNLRRALLTVPAHLLRRALQDALTPPAHRTGLLAAEARGYLAGLGSWRLSRRSTRRRSAPTASSPKA